ncbi:aminoacyl-tRNA hydrolase [Candidatus Endowatersipora endosymbiont of Watersipora subatra]|uniref:aminoacyl-tRNA hydrolase n=1 Tax=Candidatus Endowatersipora endosymbiont of Watersipora subatra TaxID=3077946 RepID=UPI00312CB240
MLIIVGLGNPGPRYEKNRHNIGFMVIDAIHRHYELSDWRPQFHSLIAEGNIEFHKILLIKPMTFINKSGNAVSEALKYYKIPTDKILVFYDELDLEPCRIKVKIGGGSSGHNGIRSIDAYIGKQYQRVRIGIGHPGYKEKVYKYVLSNFSISDQIWLIPLIDSIACNLVYLTKDDALGFMNKVNLCTQKISLLSKS